MLRAGWNLSVWPALFLAAVAAALVDAAPRKKTVGAEDWTCVVELPVPPRRGKQRPPAPACLWLPEGVKKIRGLYYPGAVMIEKKLATHRGVRAALAKEKMGVLYYHLDASIIKGGHKYLERALAELARKSGHPEVEFAPMLTAGHSAAGLFCRNVAYWKPHRVIGVVMIKSGNFHHAIEDMNRSLRGVPLIHFSGEFEQYGPEGGDLGRGLRSRYATTGDDGRRRNQTQWVMTRMQMLDRRRRHEDNVWSLVVHRGGGHTSWNDDMTALFIRYVRSLAAARIPKAELDKKAEVRCIPMTAKGGWLYDADIKNPRHKPAPYAEYKGNRKLAFWAPDETMAKAIWAYHQREPWSHPDPTARDPVEQRFYPPPILNDFVDAPPPPILRWSGGNGAWGTESRLWLRDGKAVAWDSSKQAAFDRSRGTVTVPANRTCTGLVLGEGYALDLDGNKLHVRWHARLADGAALHVRLHPRSSRGIGRGAALTIVGNAALGGALTIDVDQGLRDGDYGICMVKGIPKGDFARVILPKEYTGRWMGSTFYLTVPKRLSPQELKKRKEEEERRKDAEIRRELGLPGGETDPGPPPALPRLAP
jgi:hypothetical protein